MDDVAAGCGEGGSVEEDKVDGVGARTRHLDNGASGKLDVEGVPSAVPAEDGRIGRNPELHSEVGPVRIA